MPDTVLNFYDALADHYHLIFEDWNRSIERQASILNPLLDPSGKHLKILDCACGIGTQALGFAGRGHKVVASDLSPAEVNRARREAEIRHLDIQFHIDDMTSLSHIQDRDFDVVAALDNALPHLTPGELSQALSAARSKLKPGGLFLASMRDYDQLLLTRPTMQDPAFHGVAGERRIVHQIWDWLDERSYTLHLYLTLQAGDAWTTEHFVSRYRALVRDELTAALHTAGFGEVRWLMPSQTGFYQPIVLARHP